MLAKLWKQKKKTPSSLRERGYFGRINVIWLVRDTNSTAAIRLVRATNQSRYAYVEFYSFK